MQENEKAVLRERQSRQKEDAKDRKQKKAERKNAVDGLEATKEVPGQLVNQGLENRASAEDELTKRKEQTEERNLDEVKIKPVDPKPKRHPLKKESGQEEKILPPKPDENQEKKLELGSKKQKSRNQRTEKVPQNTHRLI